MRKIKEQIDYGGRRERMDPNLERKLRSGQDIYSSNPAMRKGSEDVQRLVSKRFGDVVDALKQVTGIDDLSPNHVKQMLMGEMMNATYDVMRRESRHKEELKELAKRICFDETEFDESWVNLEMYLNDTPIDVSNFRYEPEQDDEEEDDEEKQNMSFQSFDIEDLTPQEELELEKHKRNIINALVQGAAKKGHYVFKKPEVKEELDSMDPQLYPLYNKIMSINDFFYFTMEQMIEMMSQTGQGIAGKVELDSDGDDDDDSGGEEGGEDNADTTIKAYGMIFPILCHEIIKGIKSVNARHGYPKDTEMARKVLGQTDLLSNEPMQLRVGPGVQEKLRMAMPDAIFDPSNKGLINWFEIELFKIEAKELLGIMADVIDKDEEKNKRATARFEEIMKEAQKLKEEYEEYKKQQGITGKEQGNTSDDSDDSDDLNDDDLDDFLSSMGISRE
jgi:hypothetical protein